QVTYQILTRMARGNQDINCQIKLPKKETCVPAYGQGACGQQNPYAVSLVRSSARGRTRDSEDPASSWNHARRTGGNGGPEPRPSVSNRSRQGQCDAEDACDLGRCAGRAHP